MNKFTVAFDKMNAFGSAIANYDAAAQNPSGMAYISAHKPA